MHIFFISGIPAGNSGTGRLVQTLVKQARKHNNIKVSVLFNTPKNKDLLNDTLHNPDILNADHVVLLHPQTLGFRWCMEFLLHRKKRTWIYVLDASFFCIRSYNHIPGESSACLRCLKGKFDWALRLQCPVFPTKQDDALAFLMFLKKKVQARHIGLLAQNESYKKLLHTHFGNEAIVYKVGMWAADFDALLAPITRENKRKFLTPYFDVVFHGSSHPAKGTIWASVLANFMRDRSFLFPFLKGIDQMGCMPQENVYFSNMNWSKGLADQISQSSITLCPSLWSAPIEGALVKSIFAANRVGVVEEPTSFSSEIPDNIILKLPQDPQASAAIIRENLKRDIISNQPKIDWVNKFVADNKNVLNNIIEKLLEESD
jgi:hypothetical protein